MTNTNIETNNENSANFANDENYVEVLMVTEGYHITGKIYLPDASVVNKPTPENLLFYTLNSGRTFIALHDCTITSKDSIEFKPDEINYYIINLQTVRSCRILKK